MPEQWLRRLEHVSKGAAVERLSLTVNRGEVLGLLGPAGAGQSTILGLLAGRLRPTAGVIQRGKGRLTLLDEPPESPEVVAELCRLTREAGGAAVIATARTALARRLCDRIALIDRGRILDQFPAAALDSIAEVPHYRIRVRGHLSPRVLVWFDGFHYRAMTSGDAALVGPVPDQAALHGLLGQILNLSLPLLEVAAVDPVEWLVRDRATAAPVPGPG